MSSPEQKQGAPAAGDNRQKRSNPRRRKRRPRPESAENRQKQTQQAGKPQGERQDRPQRTHKKERNQRNRRPKREVAPVPETYEDVLRDNTRLEKEIRLDIDGFSQITLDL
ncbi:MAG TPA: hypothetical protein GXZ89_02640 [Fastidiosipila sp.]|jgi:hypothetical protein|nr:hypothetical protein [Fastidiosipila sp.]